MFRFYYPTGALQYNTLRTLLPLQWQHSLFLSTNVQYFGFQMHRLCGECTLRRHLRISNLQVNANRSHTVQSRHSNSASFLAEEKFQKPGRRYD
jgi:hypothetical protein